MARAGNALTKRECTVMDAIDRRVPIKVIAADLGVSETRVNQHIRALKDRYGASSLADLVERHRKRPLPKAAYRNAQLSGARQDGAEPNRVANEGLFFAEPGQASHEDPWLGEAAKGEPHVVPGLLDGPHPVLARLLAIFAMTLAIMAVLILSLAAARTIGEVMDGWGSVPATQQPSAG